MFVLDSYVKSKVKSLRYSAKNRNIVFDLSVRDLKKLISETNTCYYFNIPLTIDNLSVDRKDHNKGYIKSNIVLCSVKANNLKNQLFENPITKVSFKELDIFLNKLKEYYSTKENIHI